MQRTIACIVLLCLAAAALSLPTADPAEALAQTERDFAQMSMREGMYKAFVRYAAENGIQFAPHPVNVREKMSKQAQGPMPDFSLDWRPLWTDVAASDDIGFNAGPWIMSDLSPAQEKPLHGYFLSIWKKQSDGAWRFIIDAGVQVAAFPSEHLQLPWKRLPQSAFKPAKSVDTQKETQTIRDLDATLLAAVNSDGMLTAYRKVLADAALIYRQGKIPASDRATVEQYLAADKHAWTWTPIETGVSQAGDFGYVYGSFEATPKADDQKFQKGYYLRVWRRNAAGQWRLAADVIMPRLTPVASSN